MPRQRLSYVQSQGASTYGAGRGGLLAALVAGSSVGDKPHFLSSWAFYTFWKDHFSGRPKAGTLVWPIHAGSEQRNPECESPHFMWPFGRDCQFHRSTPRPSENHYSRVYHFGDHIQVDTRTNAVSTQGLPGPMGQRKRWLR